MVSEKEEQKVTPTQNYGGDNAPGRRGATGREPGWWSLLVLLAAGGGWGLRRLYALPRPRLVRRRQCRWPHQRHRAQDHRQCDRSGGARQPAGEGRAGAGAHRPARLSGRGGYGQSGAGSRPKANCRRRAWPCRGSATPRNPAPPWPTPQLADAQTEVERARIAYDQANTLRHRVRRRPMSPPSRPATTARRPTWRA